ncbi:MAG TPA: hypothetical protein VLE97_08955 [Gaiellaceae bacterium]|nr:hypothetical protein [Gaiellaceae bacterium]
MKDDLVKAALAALDAIMVDQLSGTDPARYSRVARLCGQAHQIVKMSAKRVADVAVRGQDNFPIGLGGDLLEPLDEDLGGNGGIVVRGGLGHAIMPRQPGDMVDVLREMMMGLPQFNPSLNNTSEKRVERLQKLLDVRQALAEIGHDDLSMIDTQIAQIKKELADDNDADTHATDADPAVVRTLVPRGHPAGVDRRGDHPADRREGDGAREGGARQAGPVGIEAGVVEVG